MEIWKDIKGYEGIYQVSNLGRVKSLGRLIGYNHARTRERHFRQTEEFILSNKKVRGYNCVTLCKDSIDKNKRVCRLVAKAFIENPENKAEVNHKDGVKSNDVLSNLEWVTKSENMKHAYEKGLCSIKSGGDCHNALSVKDISTGKIYPTIKDACEDLGLSKPSMSRKLRGIYNNDTPLRYVEKNI